MTEQGTSRAISPANLQAASNLIEAVRKSYQSQIVGHGELMNSLLIGLLTGGHVLLESVPGLAKTTAAKTLAHSIDAKFTRIQCTPDLMPSDIVGSEIYNSVTGQFETRLGPVHSNFVLLDEINRSSSKTQSAMLEAMEERQTTIGGKIYHMPKPFMVIATQNPIEQEGTYHLPEAQLDRFIIKDIVQYSTVDEEVEVLNRIQNSQISDNAVQPVANLGHVVTLQKLTKNVFISPAIKRYIVEVVHNSRNAVAAIGREHGEYIAVGGSPRASIGLMKGAQALALMNGRDSVIPEDVKAIRYVILRHRIALSVQAEIAGIRVEDLIDELFNSVSAP